jgi:hypothetical protein
MEPLDGLEQEEAMSREQSMQRLNILTLAAFLVGLAAFIYDFATPARASLVADAPVEAMAYLGGTPSALE